MRTARILGIVFAGLMISTAARAQQHGSLTTQDYIDIQQLYARYNVAIDSGNAEDYANTFTNDGVFNTFNGRDALLGFAKGYTGTNRRHWNTNLVITPTHDGAKGSVYLFMMDVSTRPPSIAAAIQYDDTLVKTPQGWRFKKRTTKVDTAPAAPASK
jgi:hypothetical protein